ncbi:hypothetical protein FBU59_006094, partial [Linderina macrospora]
MSRFFRGDESSDSDSDYTSSSSGSEFSDEETKQTPQQQSGGRFARAMMDSDSEDEVKRVVKSAKDKQMDEVLELSRAILKAMEADEWQSVSGDFDKVNKVVPKLAKSLKGQPLPRSYIRALASLEDAVEQPKSKAELKKLNTSNARALNQLKQRVRKHNKTYAKQIAEYKANPINSENEDGDADTEEEEDDVEEQPARAASPAPAPAAAAASGSDSEDSYWDSDSDDDESSSESEDDGPAGFQRWLKKTPTKKDGESTKLTKKEKAQKK